LQQQQEVAMLVTGKRQRQRETKHSLGRGHQTKTALKKGTSTSPEQGQQNSANFGPAKGTWERPPKYRQLHGVEQNQPSVSASLHSEQLCFVQS